MAKFRGRSFDCENEAGVREAVVSDRRLSMDYDDGQGYVGHLEADSTDGCIYRGRYGYPDYAGQEHVGDVELRRYAGGKDHVLFFGRWTEIDSGRQGNWLIELGRTSD